VRLGALARRRWEACGCAAVDRTVDRVVLHCLGLAGPGGYARGGLAAAAEATDALAAIRRLVVGGVVADEEAAAAWAKLGGAGGDPADAESMAGVEVRRALGAPACYRPSFVHRPSTWLVRARRRRDANLFRGRSLSTRGQRGSWGTLAVARAATGPTRHQALPTVCCAARQCAVAKSWRCRKTSP
jgi:hypothetical protein